jgi:phi LC3 family holin
MMKFLKKRRNKTFYITIVSQLLVATQLILALFGYEAILNAVLQDKILAATDAVLVVFSTFGVVNDPTKPGVKDSE